MKIAGKTAFNSPLAILNGLLFVVWVVALASWIAIEGHRFDDLAATQREQQQLKAADVVQRAQEETLALTNLLRSNRLIIEGLLVEDQNKLLDTTVPMMQLPYVQLLTVYRANGEIAVQAHQPDVFGRTDELRDWLARALPPDRLVNSTVAMVGKRLYLLTGGRVEDLNGLSGYVVLGTLLEKGFVDKLKLATGENIELRFKPPAASSSAKGAVVAAASAAAPASRSADSYQAVELPSHLAAAGLSIYLINPTSELREARQQNLWLGIISLLVAGAFMLTVAATSSRAMARSQQRLLLARDQADAASKSKGDLLEREEEQRRRLDLLMRCANVGSFDWDARLRQASYSPRLKEMLGYPPDADTRGWRVESFIHPEDREAVLARSVSLLNADAPANTLTHSDPYDFRLLKRDGTALSVHGDAITVAGLDGKTQKFMASFIDITPILSAEEDTRAALKRQQELNALRSRFVSMTSHEFRTPLATILTSAELLKYYDVRLSTTEKREIIHSIESGVERMTIMLDKMLNIGKAEAGMSEFKPAPLKLAQLCHSMLEHARQQQPDSICTVVADFDVDEFEGVYDEKLLRHIFDNLLSNAVKYSPLGGEVRFSVQRRDGRMVFEVSDQGIGIPPDEIEDLFGSFHRASNVGDIPGTGLGLAIVRNSVELHGGEISVTSQPGQGTCFTVRL